MTDTATGGGSAFEASISTAELQQLVRDRMDADEAAGPANRLANAKRKREKLLAQLAGVDDEIEAAKAEVAAAKTAPEGN